MQSEYVEHKLEGVFMIKHIVVYTLKDGVNKPEAIEIVRSQLEPLVGVIPGLLHMEIRATYQDKRAAVVQSALKGTV